MMFDFDTCELLMVVVAMMVAIVLGVWATFGMIGYLAADSPNDPLAKAGGLSPEQERAVDTNQ